jgi:Icc-related predicted phosphoesterase
VPVRIAAIADQHGRLPPVPACDLLVIAGDVTPIGDHSAKAQREFLEGAFSEWLVATEADAVVGIAGNHDLLAEDDPAFMAGLPWTYLSDGGTVACGLRIWGTPWAPTFGDWAFMEPDVRLARRFDAIPDGLDLLVAHTPPYEILDLARRGVHAGSESLRAALLRARPTACVFGHIHEAHGHEKVDGIRCYNAAVVDQRYVPSHRPTLFELEPRALSDLTS